MVFGERQVEIPWLVKMLQTYKGNCLDIGSAGSYIEEFKRQNLPLTRIDQLEMPDDGFSKRIHRDIRYVPNTEIGQFDVVTIISALEHVGLDAYGFKRVKTNPIEEQQKVFEHCFSFVKDEGYLIITLPFGCFEDGGWFLTYNSQMIDALIGTKFVVQEDYFTLDEDTWTYKKVHRYQCPQKGQDWPRKDFSRATSVCCLVLKKTSQPVYDKWVNLGCGGNKTKNFINVDAILSDDSIIKQDMYCYMKRCPSNFLIHIVMSHSLEHLPLIVAQDFMKECYRSLASGGLLEIVCPDSAWAMQQYLHGSFDFPTIQMWMHANQVNEFDIHQWLTDEYSMTEIARQANFIDVKIYKDRGSIAMHCRKE